MSFASLESFDSPFPHFVWRRVLGVSQIRALASWLEQIDAWKLIETDFYEQYEFSFLDVDLPSELAFLTSPGFLQRIRGSAGVFRCIPETFEKDHSGP